MTAVPDWWKGARRVSILVDNPSWVLPYAEALAKELEQVGARAKVWRNAKDIEKGEVAFFLGCVEIAGPEILARNRRNIIIHESDLPRGRGFSPVQWQILDGRNDIPVCLLEATAEADGGPVIYRDKLVFQGHELNPEIRDRQGLKTIELCLRFMNEAVPPEGEAQDGEATVYEKRGLESRRLDPDCSLADQFDLLRVVDNDRYPAFFEHRGQRYTLRIEKASLKDGSNDD